ncbi:MAG: hypothetical protein ACYDHP_14295 [Ferrimicrobium sp.]
MSGEWSVGHRAHPRLPRRAGLRPTPVRHLCPVPFMQRRDAGGMAAGSRDRRADPATEMQRRKKITLASLPPER